MQINEKKIKEILNSEKYKEILNSNDCPKHLCFFWLEERDYFAPGFYEDLPDALNHLEVAKQSMCGCSFGICRRLDKVNGKKDFFEPCEPEFAKEM